MKQWLIKRIPTRILKLLVKRDWRLRQAGRRHDGWYWADCELFLRDVFLCPDCYNDVGFAEDCPFCYPRPEKPFGVPEWLAKEPESYGYKDEPDDYIMYKGIPFFYHSCLCDHSIGENCDHCHPDGGKDD